MKALTIVIGCLLTGFILPAVVHPDDITGVWLNGDGKGQVQIYKEADRYFGKIYWLKEPNGAKGSPKTDANNPDVRQRLKPLLGAIVLRNFAFDNGEWNGGRIYDPQNGKEYKCYLKLKDANTLTVRGYIGISLLGRTDIWTRVRSPATN